MMESVKENSFGGFFFKEVLCEVRSHLIFLVHKVDNLN